MSKPKYSIEVHGRVLINTLSGTSDVIAARDYLAEMKTRVAEFGGEPWAGVMLLDEWELGGPELEPAIAEIVAWAERANRVAEAMVYSGDNAALKTFFLNTLVVPHDEKTQRAFFETKEQALEWLKGLGFTFED